MLKKPEILTYVAAAKAAGGAVDPGDLALLIAMSAHHGDYRENGRPYLVHPLEVAADDPRDETDRIVRLLHDVVEETKDKAPDYHWTPGDLEAAGLSPEIVTGVDALTWRKDQGERYFDYIVRIGLSGWEDAKIADIDNNMVDCPPERLRKYVPARAYLEAVRDGALPRGTAFGAWLATRPPAEQDWDSFTRYSAETIPANASLRGDWNAVNGPPRRAPSASAFLPGV